MIKIFKKLILSVVFALSATPLLATHAAGGNISYTCTGIPNTYLLTLTIYRDCGGATLFNTQNINVENECGETNPTVVVTREEINEVSQICTAQLPNTECSGGNLEGIEEHVYRAIVVLPAECDFWKFSWQLCARNTAANLDFSGGSCFYIETKMYSATNNCNNSPTFNSQPIPYVCANQVTNYDFGILELDGDSLVFEFDTARTNNGVAMLYEPGFTPSQPIPGIIMDPQTGLLSFTQGIEGNYVITLRIYEYDICGNLVGEMMHDIQVVVETCTNQVPVLVETPTIIQNFNNMGTSASVVGPREINLCTGDEFCFDVQFSDPNMGDNVILSSNVAQFLPGATFTQTSLGNPSTGRICWQFVQGYTGSVISINATDDICPVPGFADVAIKLDVPPSLFPGGDSTALICGTEGTINLFDYLVGYYQSNGQWYDPNDVPISNVIADASTMIAGDYKYTVKPDTSGVLCGKAPNPCVVEQSAIITVELSQLNALWSTSNVVNETCQNVNDGQAQIGPITGNFGPFTVVWDSPYGGIHDTQVVTSGNTAAQTNLYQDQGGADPWTVTVTDDNGCSISEIFFIYEGGLDINPVYDSINCFGDATGSINAQVSGGLQVGGQQFVVITNAAGDTLNGANENPPDYRQDVQLIPAGTYFINAFDNIGCEANIEIKLISRYDSRPQIEFETVNPLCHGDNTGSIVITDVINAHGTPDDVFISWAPNPPGNPPSDGTPGKVGLRNLPAGDYTVELTDTLGCTAEPSPIVITITEPEDLIGEIETVQKPLCRTNSGQTGLGLLNGRALDGTGGAGNVQQEWTHLGTGQTLVGLPTFNVRAPGLVELLLRDKNDCIWRDTLLLDSINPVADFEITSEEFYLEDIYEGEEDVKIRVTNQTDILTMKAAADPNADIIFLWNLNAGMVNDQNNWFFTNSLEERPDTVYSGVINDGPTPYDVCLVIRNSNDCVDTTCKQVLVHRIPELTLPNVFTPGAPPNEEFYFPVVGYQEFTAEVFNRYGIKVAEFTELDDKWDGNHFETGKPCSDGVYYFTYKAVTTNDTEKTGSGQIHLLRHKP